MADSRISRLLKEILVYKHPGAIEKVADCLGETYDHIWSQTHGRVNPKIEVVKAAFIVTGDQRLKRELEPEGYELVWERAAPVGLKDAEAELTDIVLASARVITRLRESAPDGRMTAEALDDLERCFCDLEKEFIEARHAIRNMSDRRGFRAVK